MWLDLREKLQKLQGGGQLCHVSSVIPLALRCRAALTTLHTLSVKAADGRRLGLLHCHSHRAEPARLKEALTPASLSCAQIEA